jgi:uncharacterized protein YcfL
MKKLLFILAIGAFAACNDSAETANEDGKDTTVIENAADTTTLKVDTSAVSTQDTAGKVVDTLKK